MYVKGTVIVATFGDIAVLLPSYSLSSWKLSDHMFRWYERPREQRCKLSAYAPSGAAHLLEALVHRGLIQRGEH